MKPNKAMRRAMARRPSTGAKADPVARINDISGTCKTTWFGLLSYLAFVGVTWMGVEDVDFFLPGRDTELPLIGVSVPTLLFFAIGPAIGALIYAYFHMQLLKLWEALAEADARIDNKPLSDHIKPWLVSDLCLSYRTDGALRPRPLSRSSHLINFLIAFWGTPIVLGAMWWASAAPHTDWLTLLACGGPLIASLYVGLSSWNRMRGLVERPEDKMHRLGLRQLALIGVAAVAITGVGWLRVEATFKNYARALWTEDQIKDSIIDWEILDYLRPADLSGVNFAQVPDTWVDRPTFRKQHRTTWCDSVGLPANICGAAPDLDSFDWQPSLGVRIARKNWCADIDTGAAEAVDCADLFADYETAFEAAWLSQREFDLASLPTFDLRGADLRQANLISAQLQGADLFRAQLQGADLFRAQLQGADLWTAQLQGARLFRAQLQGADLWRAQLQGANLERAQLQGAYLSEAQLQGADLFSAQLQGADLGGAQLQGANLIRAQLQGANLIRAQLQGANLERAQLQGANLERAQLQGANLIRAQLQGANLERAQFDAATSLNAATLRGAAFREVDFTNVPQIMDHVADSFGDASVTLPGGVTPGSQDWPTHWPTEGLNGRDFEEAWRAWQATLPDGWDKPD